MDVPVPSGRSDATSKVFDGADDRVAIVDRELNVVCADASTWDASQGLACGRPVKCYEAFLHTPGPCGTCPALELFRTSSLAMPSGIVLPQDSACGMHGALPLFGSRGEVTSILVMFGTGQGNVGREALRIVPAVSEATCTTDMIGQSSAMSEVVRFVHLVADCSAPVLIHGESGTGKELVAKTIHRLSGRRANAFVVVDCGSLPETLLESELFGHVKGAFTGASAHKRGLLEEADGGTLFLDEISETSPAFQAKLLRVLQEGEVRRVGSSRPTRIDVRVISATNKSLAELVALRLFRQDLYYRLAVLPVSLPPLRHRRTDIPLLVAHFLEASCRKYDRAVPRVTAEVMEALTEAAWPGNVRELQHYIERAVITRGGLHLPGDEAVPQDSADESESLRNSVRKAASQMERDRILAALRRTNGNRLAAAKCLRISRASLYNKLRLYQIVPPASSRRPSI